MTTTTRRGRIEIDTAVRGADQLKQATAQMGLFEKALGATGAQMLKADLASAALQKALGAVKNQLGDLVSTGLTWNDWIGSNTTAVDSMSRAISGLADKLVLSEAASKLQNDQFKASQAQLDALAKAAVHFARVNHTDVAPSIKAISDAIVAGAPTGVFRKLGMDVQFTGTQSERTAAALDLLERRFSGVAIEASNTNEKISQVKSTMTNTVGEIGQAIQASQSFKDALNSIGTAAKLMAGDLSAAISVVQTYAADIMPLMGMGGSDAQKALLGGASAAQRAQSQTQKYHESYQQAVSMGPQVPPSLIGGMSARGGGGRGGRGGGGGSSVDPLTALIDQALSSSSLPGLSMGDFGVSPTEQRGGFDVSGLADYIDNAKKAQSATEALADAMKEADMTKLAEEQSAAWDQLGASLAGSFGKGMLSAIDAAIMGQENLGVAIIAMVKQVAYQLAGDLLTRGIHASIMASTTASNILTAWQSPMWAAQAAQYYAGAGAIGAAAIGLSFAHAGVSGGGGSSASSASASAGAPSGASSGGGYRPSGSRSGSDDDRPTTVQIDIYPDPADPASMAHWRKKIRTELQN